MRLSKLILPVFACAAVLIALSFLGHQDLSTATPAPQAHFVPPELRLRLAQQSEPAPEVAPQQSPAPGTAPQQATVGIYPTTIYELDIGTSTFKAAFYVWFLWKGDLDPTPTMELVNSVEDEKITKILDKPQIQKDGSRYQIYSVQGRFFQPFTLKNFPLDEQQLSIIIEDSTHPSKDLVYVADTHDSGFSDRVSIPGWRIGAWTLKAGEHSYNTEFGDVGSGDSVYSTISYSLSIKRPFSYFLWKLLLPLCIVLAANWAALLLHPSLVDVRTALPATALLTAVFLQQSYSSTLPQVGALVLVDKIYVLAYALIIATLTRVIISATHNVRAESAQEASQRGDLIMVAAQILIFVLGTGLLLALH